MSYTHESQMSDTQNPANMHMIMIITANHYKNSWLYKMITSKMQEVYLSIDKLHVQYSRSQIEVLYELNVRIEKISENLPYPIFSWGAYICRMNRAITKPKNKDPFYTGIQDYMLIESANQVLCMN